MVLSTESESLRSGFPTLEFAHSALIAVKIIEFQTGPWRIPDNRLFLINDLCYQLYDFLSFRDSSTFSGRQFDDELLQPQKSNRFDTISKEVELALNN